MAVKGLLQFRGVEKRGYSISHLLENPPEDVLQCAIFLDKQYTPSRYPDVYDEGSPYEYYTQKDAEECINCAIGLKVKPPNEAYYVVRFKSKRRFYE